MRGLFFGDGLLDGKTRYEPARSMRELIWARTLSLGGRTGGAAADPFARAGKLVRTAARFDGALPEAQRDYCARPPPPDFGNEKTRGPTSRIAGFIFPRMNLCR